MVEITSLDPTVKYGTWTQDDLGKWRRFKIPDRYKSRIDSLDPWPREDQVAAAWTSITQRGIVVLLGSRGVGKSQLAAWLAYRHVRERHRDAKYVRADDLFDSIKPNFSSSVGSASIMAAYETTNLLVIDEIQDRSETQFEDRQLTRIIDKRYGARLPTLIIGNLRVEQVDSHLGMSICSRLREGGLVIVCEGWPDRRAASTVDSRVA